MNKSPWIQSGTQGVGIIRLIHPAMALSKIPSLSPQVSLTLTDYAKFIESNPDSFITKCHYSDQKIYQMELMKKLIEKEKLNTKLIYDIDDLLCDNPKSNPSYNNIPKDIVERKKKIIPFYDNIVVTTEYLKKYAIECGAKNVSILKNFMPDSIFKNFDKEKRVKKKNEKIIVGWMGGPSHYDDVNLMVRVMEKLKTENVEWVFMGMGKGPNTTLPFRNISLVNMSPKIKSWPVSIPLPVRDFPFQLDHLQSFDSLDVDIAIAPLLQRPFNWAKSDLKIVEYATLGLPVICSTTDEYVSTPAMNITNDLDEWADVIMMYAMSAELRKKDGEIMRDWVKRERILEKNVNEIMKAWLLK